MSKILVPPSQEEVDYEFSPYNPNGAKIIIKRYKEDVLNLFQYSIHIFEQYGNHQMFLKKSPIRKRIYLAAALVTAGLLEEREPISGNCIFSLTEKGFEQRDKLVKAGLIDG